MSDVQPIQGVVSTDSHHEGRRGCLAHSVHYSKPYIFENEMICAISETTREFLLNELDSCLIPLDNQGEPITKEDRLIVHEHF